jgi:hypothetical protein
VNRKEGRKFRERIDHSPKESVRLFTKYLLWNPHYHSHTLINMRPYNALDLTLPSFFSSFLPLFHISSPLLFSPSLSSLLSQCTGHGHGQSFFMCWRSLHLGENTHTHTHSHTCTHTRIYTHTTSVTSCTVTCQCHIIILHTAILPLPSYPIPSYLALSSLKCRHSSVQSTMLYCNSISLHRKTNLRTFYLTFRPY